MTFIQLIHCINFEYIVKCLLTTLLPEMMVQMTMPAVIINTDKYFENSYRFRKIIIPITIFAINEPCKIKPFYYFYYQLAMEKGGKNFKGKNKLIETHRPKDHMQWHRNIKIKCIII